MLKIGLTGGIGCGKSTASAVLQELGAYIFEADNEAKSLLTKDETVQSELIAEFGTDIMQFDKISSKGDATIFVVDGALIYESGYDQHLDYVIVVTALMKNRMERALNRGSLTRQDILQRIDLQWSEEEKMGLADFVIHNDSTEDYLREEITSIYQTIV